MDEFEKKRTNKEESICKKYLVLSYKITVGGIKDDYESFET